MSDTKLTGFYHPWPNLGVKLSRQWEKLRDNTEKEAPLIRAAYVDAQPSSANDPGNHDLSGWAIGERDFRNRFRIWYDKTNDRFSIQYNSGTEAVEVWDDYLSIRQVDGRVTVHGYGGLDTTVGGFYTPLSRNLAVSGTFTPASTEWVWEHSLSTKPILWNTFNMEDKSIVPQSVDVSNPDIAYFYFSQPYAGRAIAVAEVARGDGIRVTDGVNNYTQSTILSFNYGHFYITHGLEGYPTINLHPNAGDLIGNHNSLNNLTSDDHPQYLLTSDASSRAAFAANWSDLTDGGNTSLHSHTVDHGVLTGLADDDHTQYSLADGTRAFTGTVAGVTPTADAHLTTKSYVDTRFADFYRNALPTDHGSLGGLSDDDHTQYLRTDGTRALTGDQSAGGNDITNIGSLNFTEQGSNPTTPDSTHGVLWAKDNQGHTVLHWMDDQGATDEYEIGRDNLLIVRNVTGSTIARGVPVYVSGTTGNVAQITPANANSTSTMPCIGITAMSIANNAYGRIMTQGHLTGINTTSYSAGDSLWVGTSAGTLTNTEPTHPNLSQQLAIVLSSGVSGELLVTTGHADGDDFGTVSDTFTIGSTTAGSLIIAKSSSAARTATFPNKSGTVAYIDDISSGFYGIIVGETDGTPSAMRTDTVRFNSESFYITPDSTGKPIINLRGIVGSGGGSGINNVVEDTSPQLGGDLDVNGFSIVTPAVTGVAEANDIILIAGDSEDGNAGAVTIQAGFASGIGGQGSVVISSVGGGVSISAAEGVALNGSGISIGASVAAITLSPATHVTVSGFPIKDLQDPTEAQDAATKIYVDNRAGQFYGVWFRETDGSPNFKNDTIYFNSGDFYLTPNSVGKPILNFRGSSGGGGGGINNVVEDTSPQLGGHLDVNAFDIIGATGNDITDGGHINILAGDSSAGGVGGTVTINSGSSVAGTAGDIVVNAGDGTLSILGAGGITVSHQMSMASNKITNLATPTAATDAANKGYVDAAIGPGFYGIHFRETDGNPPGFRNDTIYFNSGDFYLTPNSVGKPILNFRGSSGGSGLSSITVKDIDGNPTVAATTIQFTNGSVTDQGGGVAEVTIGSGGGIATLTVGADSFGSQTTLGFSKEDFYLSGGATSKVLNLRNTVDIYKGHMSGVIADNFFLEPDAEHAFTVLDATLDCRAGSATVGFYIIRESNLGLPGRAITGMDPITVTTSKTKATATALNTMNVGDRLVLSVYGVASTEHLVYKVRLQKT